MSRAILLFGANGQVGWELQRSLAVLGPVVALDRAAVDLTSPAAITALIDAQRPQAIVNAAAYTAVDKAEQQRELAFAINAAAPGAMATAAAKAGIPFIHYSSDYVYAGNKPGVYVETDATGPLSAYGHSKLAGDEAVLACGGQAVILRTSWVYAARGANFMKTMLRLAGKRDSLKVVGDQVGAPTSAELLADVAAQVLKQMLVDASLRGVYHCAAAGETSWHGYASFVIGEARRLGAPLKLDAANIAAITTADYPTPAKRPANSRLDCSALERTFGLQLPHWQVHVLRTLKEILA
jgi:dTDP-4-dehydrorhamnose reductase